MRIAVVNNCVPFVTGGAEHLAQALTTKLIECGHQAILFRFPFRWEPADKIVESMFASRLFCLPNVDRVIALKFPAYYIPHDNKVLWLLHQFRQAYDLWGTDLQALPSSAEGQGIRDAIRQADTRFLGEACKIYTNSRVTSDRLKKFNGLESEVLWPPLLESRHFCCRDYEDFVFYPSRVNGAKRQLLAVESMKYLHSPVRLVLAGKDEDPAEGNNIENAILENGLRDRVVWYREFISEETKAELFSRALGTLYIPYDEDSYGYVTLESYFSEKPVITCSDSGGTDVVVKDGVTGYMVPPEPQAIAAAIDRLYADKEAARSMGRAGRALVQELGITWERVIERLTQ
jgi:glycosyltransferase involved in cell wall biosynthesis